MDVPNSIIIRIQSQFIRWYSFRFFLPVNLDSDLCLAFEQITITHSNFPSSWSPLLTQLPLFRAIHRRVGSSPNMVGTNQIGWHNLPSLVGIGFSVKFPMSLYVPACLIQQQWHQPQKYMMNVFCRHHQFSLTEPAIKLCKVQVNPNPRNFQK